ncbi:hypothetical protein BDN70DRAFT_933571 [Pholiota conissans]|uniref:Tcp11-domain-containing protein n=1 Tax=Pholiota conissans TaxID=109636 RepID=A0A9P6D005_9AGAR|nr:hypothetical protein BDN70DRAFT_933571 [Pholiota conissans]
MDSDFLTHRPLKRKLSAEDDEAPGPTQQHSQSADSQARVHALASPPAECSGSSSNSAGSGGGMSISIGNTPDAPRQAWVTDPNGAATAAARRGWESPSLSPMASPISSPTTATAAPQVSSPLSPARSNKRLRVDTQEVIVRPPSARAHNHGNARHYPRPSALQKPTTPLAAPPITFRTRQGSDLEDIGVVSCAAPGPASGSLLRAPRGSTGEGAGGHGSVEVNNDGSTSPLVSNGHTVTPATVYYAVPAPMLQKLSRSPHIPPMTPLITRATLRELELDVILRNPVVRHDLLFDTGVQFRPRRTRAACDRYWNAVWREVCNGCTCVTLDGQNGLHPTRCICEQAIRQLASPTIPLPPTVANSPTTPSPETAPNTPTIVAPPSLPPTHATPTPPTTPAATHPNGILQPLYTLRTPPRLPILLSELRAVLMLVVQPLSTSTTAVYTNPAAVRAQAEEHARHAGHLREVLDEVLEVAVTGGRGGQGMSGVDLGPVFERIGETLKRHCAPMRDRRVDTMVETAKLGGARAFGAVRMCLELLELMKLDIANHQLAQLRPWLLRNTSGFEAKAFRIRFGSDPHALQQTRLWLAAADHSLRGEEATSQTPAPGPLAHIFYQDLTRNKRIFLSALKGLVDLVFSIPGEIPVFTLAEVEKEQEVGKDGKSEGRIKETGKTNVGMLEEAKKLFSTAHILPETLYLDKTRLALLSSEASDATSLYMFSLLFRQLVSVDTPGIRSDADMTNALDQLKTELRVLAPAGLHTCFVVPEVQNNEAEKENRKEEELKKEDTDADMADALALQQQRSKKEKDTEDERNRRRRVREDIALQIASRAEAIRQRLRQPVARMNGSTVTETPSQHATPIVPSSALLSLAQSWTETNLQPTSPFARRLHNRVRDAVLDEVIALVHPSANTPSSAGIDISSAGGMHVFTGRAGHPNASPSASGLHTTGLTTTLPPRPLVNAGQKSLQGLDALTVEIHRLSARVARLAEVHLSTYLLMYETEGFCQGNDA